MSNWKTDGRIRPVFVEINGEKDVALSTGDGRLYIKEGYDLYDYASCKSSEGMKELVDYKYLRGCSGHDF
jgi:hypothetical protein